MGKKGSKMSTLTFDNQGRPKKTPLTCTPAYKIVPLQAHFHWPVSQANPRREWPKEPPRIQPGCPRAAQRKDNCVRAVFCQLNPSQGHLWNVGSGKVNLQLKRRSALNWSGSKMLQEEGCTVCAELSQSGCTCTRTGNQSRHFERKGVLVCWCNVFVPVQTP